MPETLFVLTPGEQFLVMNLDGSVKRYQAQGWGIQRMDNTGQFVMAEEEIREETEDERPHSRACGIHRHNHGTACAVDCPTCGGEEWHPN